MSNPVAVHWFDSTMAGAPAMSGTAGTLIGVLDACLVNGFGSVTLDSLVISNGVATATRGSGHGFFDHTVILIGGATPAEANGEKRITRVSSSVFTFDATGISNQTATGTITAKMAPVGWEKRYSGTNKAAYARTDVAATAMLLRVDDTPAQYPTLIMYESMSGLDTDLVGPAPPTGSLFYNKSNVASSTARAWRLYADDQAVFLMSTTDGANEGVAGCFFGDILSYVAADGYACGLIAHGSIGSTSTLAAIDNNTTAAYLAKAYTLTGSAVAIGRNSHQRGNTTMANAGIAYPNAAGNLFLCAQVDVWENSEATCRGVMPGIYSPLHAQSALTGGDFITHSSLGDRRLRIQKIYNGAAAGACAMDITGPWR